MKENVKTSEWNEASKMQICIPKVKKSAKLIYENVESYVHVIGLLNNF